MNTTIRGRKGEDLAAESYQKQGFTILKRNYRFGRAEVDIIAQKGDTLAIVEVKWRSNTYFGDPQSFVSKKQHSKQKGPTRTFSRFQLKKCNMSHFIFRWTKVCFLLICSVRDCCFCVFE